jgi:hypothetical protein
LSLKEHIVNKNSNIDDNKIEAPYKFKSYEKMQIAIPHPKTPIDDSITTMLLNANIKNKH